MTDDHGNQMAFESLLLELKVTLNYVGPYIELQWSGGSNARCRITCTGYNELTWAFHPPELGTDYSKCHLNSIRARVQRLCARFPINSERVVFETVNPDASGKPVRTPLPRPDNWDRYDAWRVIEAHISQMAFQLRQTFSADAGYDREVDPEPLAPPPPSPFGRDEFGYAEFFHREQKREEKAAREAEELARRMEMMRAKREQKEAQQEKERRSRAAQAALETIKRSTAPVPIPLPTPPIPVSLQLQNVELQTSFLPLPDLRGYFLSETAARWWVSNQSDDLLALPYCRITHLEYQIRTALRIIGPLRGRALLSDEVGLGKTIEAGLVLKEYLIRGMVKRFLILTVPSLVDQWEEELQEKFDLACVTTNQPVFRADPAGFWLANPFIIASLHTLKMPAHLQVAQSLTWDMLVVDEAHYLRKSTAQAWQAVNALPRQFLLLLTATPVQNSLEDLYNLVTLLHPGQLPSPKEFRDRFMDKHKPHQPREPEELRRLLGQVMIRNTRANAGIRLPARRAETVLFEPNEQELAFWQEWDRQFRQALAVLPASQASLWGRLVLQAAGSSPAAWRDALEKFPDRALARQWRENAPLEASWDKKCELVTPLTRGEGGVVIFTQFLETQAALAEKLRAAQVKVHVINGQTPAPQRQPITEEFHRHGGALLLTHSGTEGRNLQFSHRLVNFDLPWNPMEIEQRIGRLHRLGQQHPVRIYNLVQKHTLQEHLLNILQEKLNLFELVVGETGLILGDRFTSEEFADEVLRRWRDSEGRVAESLQALGEDLAAANADYTQIKQLDETLFAKDYETL